jgi:hypothetical protein
MLIVITIAHNEITVKGDHQLRTQIFENLFYERCLLTAKPVTVSPLHNEDKRAGQSINKRIYEYENGKRQRCRRNLLAQSHGSSIQ